MRVFLHCSAPLAGPGLCADLCLMCLREGVCWLLEVFVTPEFSCVRCGVIFVTSAANGSTDTADELCLNCKMVGAV